MAFHLKKSTCPSNDLEDHGQGHGQGHYGMPPLKSYNFYLKHFSLKFIFSE